MAYDLKKESDVKEYIEKLGIEYRFGCYSEKKPEDINCTQPAIDDFPRDLFSEAQRQSGAVVLHVIASLYLFVALAVVCDEYFVPAVEKICAALNMSNDVAGATFMAAATSAPELFVNVIGTFITEGDIGVGTIVGSAVFNILAVAACCGIGAGMTIPLDWWPLTRDSIAYGVTVAILICVMHDERVEWYEALILVSLYAVYLAVMYFDKTFQRCAKGEYPHLPFTVIIHSVILFQDTYICTIIEGAREIVMGRDSGRTQLFDRLLVLPE
ncbi:GL18327 [Drosophila persimilis]|uniref:GL18327 n=1 Tax=Drosophila persimilis TaxID=7234 RepID=B4H4G6_DROPE|nr:GL18327 [Drosophila persimilis]